MTANEIYIIEPGMTVDWLRKLLSFTSPSYVVKSVAGADGRAVILLSDPGDEIGCIKCGWTGEEWLSVCGGDGWAGKPCPHCVNDKVSA